MDKIRVGIVNYLNTAPLLYGLEHEEINREIELIKAYPSKLARLLQEKEVDVGLIPVAVIPEIESASIVSNFCIGCDGPVGSVCIFSDVPLSEVKTVLMDYQSRTSVELAKILLRQYWKVSPTILPGSTGFETNIHDATAGLVIGDRSFEQRQRSQFIYDLGEAWKEMTGLPFVFAAWVANRELDRPFLDRFDRANGLGLQSLEKLIRPYPLFNLHDYYTKFINYSLDEPKKKALAKFLSLLGYS